MGHTQETEKNRLRLTGKWFSKRTAPAVASSQSSHPHGRTRVLRQFLTSHVSPAPGSLPRAPRRGLKPDQGKSRQIKPNQAKKFLRRFQTVNFVPLHPSELWRRRTLDFRSLSAQPPRTANRERHQIQHCKLCSTGTGLDHNIHIHYSKPSSFGQIDVRSSAKKRSPITRPFAPAFRD